MYINQRVFRFRLIQIKKVIKEIPLPYLVVLLLIVLALFVGIYQILKTYQGVQTPVAGVVLLLYLLHSKRKDYHFITLIDTSPWRVFCLDYLFIVLPVVILMLVQAQYWAALALLVGCFIVSVLKQPFGQHIKRVPIPKFIPVNLFEFRSGIRRLGIVWIVLNLAAWTSLPFLPYLPLALLWFALLLSFDFFDTGESKAILCSMELPVGKFLQRKIGNYLLLYAACIAPICLIYPFVHTENPWMSALFFGATLLNVALVILAKYAYYYPGRVVKLKLSMVLAVSSILVPIFLPVTAVLLVRHYLMARRNLTSYLYAYN